MCFNNSILCVHSFICTLENHNIRVLKLHIFGAIGTHENSGTTNYRTEHAHAEHQRAFNMTALRQPNTTQNHWHGLRSLGVYLHGRQPDMFVLCGDRI
jgi:hypothetical protein